MKKLIQSLFYAALALCGTAAVAQVKIGDNPTTIAPSAALEIESTNKAFLLPRPANTAAITNPEDGMLIYDRSSSCLKVYEGGAWSNCLSAGSNSSAINNCDANGLTGGFFKNIALGTASFSVTVTNNSFNSIAVSFAASDLVLTGVAGIAVGTPSPATVTLASGQSQVVTYPLTGTATSAGTLTAKWSKVSLSCVKTRPVLDLVPAMADTQYCTNAALNDNFAVGVPVTSAATFTVTLTNNGTAAIDNIPAPAASNLVLSGAGSAGVTVQSVSPTGSYSLAPGASRLLTYTLSGTPTATGSLTASWSYAGFTCTKSKTVTTLQSRLNDGNYANTATLNGVYVATAKIVGGNHTFKVTITNNGSTTVSNIVPPGAANLTFTGTGAPGMAVAAVTPTAAFSLAAGESQDIVYTLGGTPTTQGTMTANFSFNGFSVARSATVIFGIKDKYYDLTTNGANNHYFIYREVTAADGSVWLNNNLGAEYARMGSSSFNPQQQATSTTDAYAYGSLFQWGRLGTGHELTVPVSPTTTASLSGVSSTLATVDDPQTAAFIINGTGNAWRAGGGLNEHWQGNHWSNPCPSGYRIPSENEIMSALGGTSSTVLTGALKPTFSGKRSGVDGAFNNNGVYGYWWASDAQSFDISGYVIFTSGGSAYSYQAGQTARTWGQAVRCRKM